MVQYLPVAGFRFRLVGLVESVSNPDIFGGFGSNPAHAFTEGSLYGFGFENIDTGSMHVTPYPINLDCSQ